MVEILYQDAQVIVCCKPAGVLSQGDGADAMPALLRAQCGGDIFPVHRLDRVSAGVMVYARTARAAAALSASAQAGRWQKEYLAVLSAAPAAPEGILEDLLYFDRARDKSFVCKRPRAGVKAAKLAYTVVSTAQDGNQRRALVRVRLFTGRTHQIRAQFSSRALPLLGDGKYGGGDNRCKTALFSAHLQFPHPETGEEMTFKAKPPKVFPWTMFEVSS